MLNLLKKAIVSSVLLTAVEASTQSDTLSSIENPCSSNALPSTEALPVVNATVANGLSELTTISSSFLSRCTALTQVDLRVSDLEAIEKLGLSSSNSD